MPLYAPSGGGSAFGHWDNIITKGTTQSVENSATLTDDTELQFAMVAGTYEVEADILYLTTSATNFKWGVVYPDVTNANQVVGYRRDYSTGGSLGQTIPQSAVLGQWPGNGGVQIGLPANSLQMPMKFSLIIVCVTPGDFKYQFAQGSAGGAGTFARTLAGSTMRYKKLTA